MILVERDFGLILDAAVPGGIIAVMEQDEFPGWGGTFVCALVISLAMWGVSTVLPGLLALLGIVAGAVIGGFIISWLCGMSVKRASIAASIFLAYKIAMALLCLGLLATGGES